MKKFLIGFFGGGILGVAFGFAVGIFVYPFIFLAHIEAQETLADTSTIAASGDSTDTAGTEVAERVLLGRGEFSHVDRVHWGDGHVSLYREPDGSVVVFLEGDFEVGPGPAYRVYVKDAADISDRGDFQSSNGANLGTLRAFKGSQVYKVPSSVNADTIESVVIWCEQFSVLISPATLAGS